VNITEYVNEGPVPLDTQTDEIVPPASNELMDYTD
jgi:hypothetical protein